MMPAFVKMNLRDVEMTTSSRVGYISLGLRRELALEGHNFTTKFWPAIQSQKRD